MGLRLMQFAGIFLLESIWLNALRNYRLPVLSFFSATDCQPWETLTWRYELIQWFMLVVGFICRSQIRLTLPRFGGQSWVRSDCCSLGQFEGVCYVLDSRLLIGSISRATRLLLIIRLGSWPYSSSCGCVADHRWIYRVGWGVCVGGIICPRHSDEILKHYSLLDYFSNT